MTPQARAQPPSFAQVKAGFTSSEALLLDRHGQTLQRLRVDPQLRRGAWIALPDISPALRQAIVLSEDKRFYEHSGVDWRAVSAAAWSNLWNTRTRGASTLTMQLAGLLDEDLRQRGGAGRSVTQKIGQAVSARQLEGHWRKSQILEAYLNLVPFRGELAGIDALSRTLFGKAAHGLNDEESAIAAALVRAPNAAAARVSARACGVLRSMRGKTADCAAIDLQTAAALARRAWPSAEGIAPHLARKLLAGQSGGARVQSTLQANLQRFALQTLQQHVRELQTQNVHDGAVLVLDNASGQILAWVGSTGDALSGAAQVDAVTARRQPGSTLKPFLYAQALAEKRLTAASLLHDSPAHLQTGSGLYIPQNFDLQYKGWVSTRAALAASLNIPAVRTAAMVTPEALARQLNALGLNLRESGNYYSYSLALGSAEVTLLDLTNAYRALANQGLYSPPVFTPGGKPAAASARAIDAAAAFIVGDILADPIARAPTFDTGSVLATRFWSAVKTGTSKDMRDNWAIGWSQHYTVGVWVGNASGAAMWDVSGASGAAPVWAAIMRYLHGNKSDGSDGGATASRAPKAPPGVTKTPVRFEGVAEAARDEWFISGTAQRVFALSAATPANASNPGGGVATRITAPQNETIIALDPDIPPRHQRLWFTAAPGSARGAALRWTIGQREIGRGPQIAWPPWPGRHSIQLRDAKGQ
ncbi:MAG: penicillin-binding protein 1C, partial [Burkholderiaceae bacterium]|nr:penicillin-binding protein 1C [Burkholderiaceae bacterium]